MVHPADAEAWKYFDGRHSEKAGESRNVRVALAIDGFNPYGMTAAPTITAMEIRFIHSLDAFYFIFNVV